MNEAHRSSASHLCTWGFHTAMPWFHGPCLTRRERLVNVCTCHLRHGPSLWTFRGQVILCCEGCPVQVRGSVASLVSVCQTQPFPPLWEPKMSPGIAQRPAGRDGGVKITCLRAPDLALSSDFLVGGMVSQGSSSQLRGLHFSV